MGCVERLADGERARAGHGCAIAGACGREDCAASSGRNTWQTAQMLDVSGMEGVPGSAGQGKARVTGDRSFVRGGDGGCARPSCSSASNQS